MCLKEKKLSWQVFLIHSTDEIINLVRTTFVYLKAITSRITFALLLDCSWRLHGSGFLRLQQDVWMVFGGTCNCKGPENCLTCLTALQTPVNLARSLIYLFMACLFETWKSIDVYKERDIWNAESKCWSTSSICQYSGLFYMAKRWQSINQILSVLPRQTQTHSGYWSLHRGPSLLNTRSLT